MNLTVDDLCFSYGKRRILRDVSFSVSTGDFLSVLGPNGVGKSTLFRCLLGLMSGYGGRILLDGRDIRSLSRKEMAKKIAYIPQVSKPVFGFTALDTVLMGATGGQCAFSRPRQKHVDRAWQALHRAGADHLAGRDYTTLSGGEQQLVLVARALAQQSEILIMDEPTSALDYGHQMHVLQLVRQLAREGYAVLLSTHNPQHALTYAGSVLALSGGSVAACGDTCSVLTGDLVSNLYGVHTCFADTPYGRMLVAVDAQ